MTDLLTQNKKLRSQLLAVDIALLPLLTVSVFYHGLRMLIVALISIATCLAADFICRIGSSFYSKNSSAVFSFTIGLSLVMLLPASVPYWLVAVGSAFAIFIVRVPFGGHSYSLFQPAATAFAFLLLCWNSLCTAYPENMNWLPLSPSLSVPLFSSPAYRLMLGGAEKVSTLDALLGNFFGPAGAKCILIILLCGVFLAIKKVIFWQIPVTAIAVVSFFAYAFPRISVSNPLNSVKLELTSGCFLFVLIFFASIDSNEIRSFLGKMIYGLLFGLLTVLFRSLSQVEMVSPFVLIIMSTIDNQCDRYGKLIVSAVKAAVWGIKKCIIALFTAARKGLSFLWNRFFELLQRFVDPSGEASDENRKQADREGGKDK